jgi:hypothetical protein
VTRLVAQFDSPDAVARAVEAASRAGWRTVSICSPAFDEKLLRLVHATRSPVAAWALVSGIVGTASGFLLTIGTVREWPRLIVSGKPLISTPPFLIIVFELAILFAALAAAVSFLVSSKRARRRAGPICDATTTDSRFALLVESTGSIAETDQLLNSIGALEWRRL